MGYENDQMTAHGFRTLASTDLNEQGWNSDLIEMSLAHAEGNSVRAAYNRAESSAVVGRLARRVESRAGTYQDMTIELSQMRKREKIWRTIQLGGEVSKCSKKQ